MMDGGCSYHISGDRSKFVEGSLRKCRRRRIFGFDTKAEGIVSEQMGDIEFEGIKDGKVCTVKIRNVIYVPQMEQLTLVSQGILDKLGYSFFGKRGNMSMYDDKNSKVFEAQLTKEDGLYHCYIESVGLCFNSTAVIQSLKEAHNTLIWTYK
jgi:hypothetical protein